MHKFNHTHLYHKLFVFVVASVMNFNVFAQQDDNQASLDKLFVALAHSTSEFQAKQIEQLIWSIWFMSQDSKVDVLLQELVDARQNRDYQTALSVSNQIIKLKPEYAEGWNQRATTQFLLGNYEESLADIVETLKREPRHFWCIIW